MTAFAPNATVVLVHGAWADGSCWQNIILPLRQEGLAVTWRFRERGRSQRFTRSNHDSRCCAAANLSELYSRESSGAWFLLAEEDRMIPADTQLFMAERMGATIRRYHVDHSPMYTAPDVVVRIILEAAEAQPVRRRQ